MNNEPYNPKVAKDIITLLLILYNQIDGSGGETTKKALKSPISKAELVDSCSIKGVISGALWKWKGKNYCIFRGSLSAYEYFHSFRHHQTDLFVKDRDVKVHQGFWKLFSGIEDFVSRLPDDVIIGGHSLGGALAHLTAFYLSLNKKRCSCYTFGTPRIGNKEFCDVYDSIVPCSYRIVNTEDTLAWLPLVFQPLAKGPLIYSNVKGTKVFTVNKVSSCHNVRAATTANHSSELYYEATVKLL
jgi:hypothetical protein